MKALGPAPIQCVTPELPKYKVGDFVKCAYDFYDFYSYVYDEEDYAHFRFYGIIVDVILDDVTWWFTTETVYHIYCLDGIHRFFLEDEVDLAQLPRKELTTRSSSDILLTWLRGGIGRHDRLKICCSQSVWVQVPPKLPL